MNPFYRAIVVGAISVVGLVVGALGTTLAQTLGYVEIAEFIPAFALGVVSFYLFDRMLSLEVADES